jgi:hypothetical protein
MAEELLPKIIVDSPRMVKSIVILGKTGLGKSKLLNLLYKQSIEEKELNDPFEVLGRGTGGTRQIIRRLNHKQGFYFVDTVGLCDPIAAPNHGVYLAYNFLRMLVESKFFLIFVIDDRLTQEECMLLLSLREILPIDWHKKVMFVKTRSTDPMDMGSFKQFPDDITNDQKLTFQQAFNMITDPTPIENSDSKRIQDVVLEDRSRFLINFRDFTSTGNELSIVSWTWPQLVVKFCKFFVRSIKLSRIQNILKTVSGCNPRDHLGDCEECKEPFTFDNFQVLFCHHLICSNCFSNADKCPFCKALVAQECKICMESKNLTAFYIYRCAHSCCIECKKRTINNRCPFCNLE